MVVGDDGLVDDEVVVVGLHQNAVFCFFKWSIPGLIFFILRLICPLSFGTKTRFKWLREESHVPKVVGSIPSIICWMDIFHIKLL